MEKHLATVKRPQGKWFLVSGPGAGCGGFLNPPTHPTRAHHIEERAFNGTCRSFMWIHANDAWVPASVKREGRKILDAWTPLPADHPDVVEWRSQVLGYFKGCYRNPSAPEAEQWHAGKMLIIPAPAPPDGVSRIEGPTRDPVEWADDHAGVHLIREFYPYFTPTAEDFAIAKWGK